MRIKKLTLENIRSYDDETLEFPDGSILVHGPNGAGKTSLLMGIFGGLYTSKIGKVGNNDFNIAELVRRGEDEGRIELTFAVSESTYTLEWNIYRGNRGSQVTLESDVLDSSITSVIEARERIEELLGMDKDDFASSVYVKQGEINRLFQSDTRTELIDSLLGLDTFDTYIERAKQARRGAERVRRDNEQSYENFKEQKGEFEQDESDLEGEIEELSNEIDEQEAERDDISDQLDELQNRQQEIED